MIHIGDCRESMRGMVENSIDAIVTDPPYGLSKQPDMAEVLRHWLAGDDYKSNGGGFMGKSWDSFVPGPATWREAYRVLKPGGYALVFAGSRTQDLMGVSLRLAGFEVRDCLMWIYGSGFPKSLDISKAIDKAAGVEFTASPAAGVGFMNPDGEGGYNKTMNRLNRAGDSTEAAQQWDGWGTALKPAYEPVLLVRKPPEGTIVDNVLSHGVGGLNIDGCRIGRSDDDRTEYGVNGDESSNACDGIITGERARVAYTPDPSGRWPANVMHDGACDNEPWAGYFYCPKASKADRNEGCEHLDHAAAGDMTGGRVEGSDGLNSPRAGAGRTAGAHNHHPTVKPTALMQYLCRLVTPPGGTILDPFTGSGSTGKAAVLEGFDFIGCERDEDYARIAQVRIDHALIQYYCN